MRLESKIKKKRTVDYQSKIIANNNDNNNNNNESKNIKFRNTQNVQPDVQKTLDFVRKLPILQIIKKYKFIKSDSLRESL